MTSDEDLAVAAQNGDRAAAQELLTRYERRLFALSLRLLRNREDAAETVQHAMMKTLENLDRYDPSRPFSPWIYRITRNACVDRHRRRKTRSEDELDDSRTASAAWDESSRMHRPADQVVQQRELDAAIEKGMATLGEKYRQIIRMYHFEHLSYRDIAERLGLPDGTVMNRLFRARRKLQAALNEMGVTP